MYMYNTRDTLDMGWDIGPSDHPEVWMVGPSYQYPRDTL